MSITEDQLVVPTRDVNADIIEEPKFIPLTTRETEIALDDDDCGDSTAAEAVEETPKDATDATNIEEFYRLTAHEQVGILRHYTAYERLLVALPLISSRNPGAKLTHAEIGFIVSSSREKVCRALKLIRTKNPDIDLSCVNFSLGNPGTVR